MELICNSTLCQRYSHTYHRQTQIYVYKIMLSLIIFAISWVHEEKQGKPVNVELHLHLKCEVKVVQQLSGSICVNRCIWFCLCSVSKDILFVECIWKCCELYEIVICINAIDSAISLSNATENNIFLALLILNCQRYSYNEM